MLIDGVKVIIVVIVVNFVKQWWVLPEIERARCRRVVYHEYRADVETISTSLLSDDSKARAIEFYQERLEKKLERLCGGSQ